MTSDLCMAVPVWQAILLGILQGFTEFLPISSSAHLILIRELLEWQPMDLTFDVMLHVGTLLALLFVFRQQWRQLWGEFLERFRRAHSGRKRASTQLVDGLILGTLPALLVGGWLQGRIEDHLRTPTITLVTLPLFGLLLWWADRAGSQQRDLKSVRRVDGLVVGIAQALALVPGVSRSGVTITAALFLGLSRTDSARFSFLLSAPLLALAAAGRLFHLWQVYPALPHLGVPLLFGVTFSFITGCLCVKYFLRFLITHTYSPFVLYRLLLAAFIFAWLLS